MNQYLEQIRKQIEEADLVVVGLGEEWNLSVEAQEGERYQKIMSDLKQQPQYRWILPYVYLKLTDDTLLKAYEALFHILDGKNYFVVATTMNRSFVPFAQEEKVVMPCGSDTILSEISGYQEFLTSLEQYVNGKISLEDVAFLHDEAGKVIPFNNVYAIAYQEDEYLPQWKKYMNWLQGTMNRKTCLLELGAGMKFPSVFRFPFEKMAYFNKKAMCFRVHKTLYQVTAEMAERSISVPVHSVELFTQD